MEKSGRLSSVGPEILPKKSGRLSSARAEIQAFVSHCSANFKPILDCFIPHYKLKYEDSENVNADRVNTVVFNLHQIKRGAFFFGTPGTRCTKFH